MANIFFTADLHFGHKNILLFENRCRCDKETLETRPFKDVSEMDNYIIQRWNSTVDKTDTVFIAGDLSFYDKEKTTNVVQRLKGTKILIKGNHDTKSNQWYRDVGIKEVSGYPIIVNEWFAIQHEPPTFYNEHCPYFYIYGHVHNCEMYQTYTKRSCCVCVERHDYTPVLFDDIKSMIAKA